MKTLLINALSVKVTEELIRNYLATEVIKDNKDFILESYALDNGVLVVEYGIRVLLPKERDRKFGPTYESREIIIKSLC
jgi:hypothetical protein